MFWYHWLGGDNVLGNELIKSILIRVQVETSKICIYERIKKTEQKQWLYGLLKIWLNFDHLKVPN